MTVIQKPKYQQISLDIARKIINGNLKEGNKIFGRSELAALYNVSPETIRRAIAVLKDMGVVEVTQGSGIIIKSKELAFRYVNRFNETYSIVQIKNEIKNLIENKKEIDNKIDNLIEKVVEYSSSLKNINPFNPFEIEVNKPTHAIGKTISDLKFWQNTGGTIIGIRRGEKLYLSPGPYSEINKGDVLIIVGDEDVMEKTLKFLYEN